MNKTKIEWCDYTWNPVTGCWHGCPFCYASKIATRFDSGGWVQAYKFRFKYHDEPLYEVFEKGLPFPHGFEPTFYHYRLDDPQKVKKSQRVFVCSMSDLFGCYDERTEVLTIDGWKYFKDISEEDELAYLDIRTDSMRYSKPKSITRMRYKGIMYSIKTKSINLMVTPNHKMYVSQRPTTVKGREQRKKDYEFNLIAAENLFNKAVHYKRNFNWDGDEMSNFTLPNSDIVIPMDLWLEFFGYFISEGSAFTTCGRNRVSMPQIKPNNRFYEVCEQIAGYCGVKYRKDIDRCIIGSKPLKEYLVQFGHSNEKYIPKEIKQLSKRQLKILLKALIVGDGNRLKTASTAYGYYTVSKRLADDVQEISLKSGFVANVTGRIPRTYHNVEMGREIIGRHYQYEVVIGTKSVMPEVNYRRTIKRNHTKTESWVEYDGYVYCAEVPSHVLYVRRNGKSCWCGNSWVPDEWIKDVFEACMKAPQHKYLFLTKNPGRYTELADKRLLPEFENMWFGSTVTVPKDTFWRSMRYNSFLSIEPILESFGRPENPFQYAKWIIVGAETGNRKGRVIPKREWIEDIVATCRETDTPVFMKDSLKELMGDDFAQEWPEGLK